MTMPYAAETVAHNPWLLCAFLFAARFAGLGSCWSWCVAGKAGSAAARVVRSGAATLLTGLLLNALCAVLLAEAGAYRPHAEAVILGGLAGVGLALGLLRRGPAFIAHLRDVLPVLAATFAAGAAIMGLPGRGEWIAGGWDPGIYVNQGVAVSRTATFHPPPEPVLAELTRAELEVMTRTAHNYREYLPVVPLDADTRRIQHFFFRFTPAYIAVLERCGGLRAATRANLFAGWVALWAVAAVVTGSGRGGLYALVALAALLTHPVWWFLAHFPTSEMVQLALVMGALAWARSSPAGSLQGPLFTACLLFAAMVNRFSFFPFAGLLLCTLTWIDLPREDRLRVWATRWLQAAAVLAGLFVDARCGKVTIGRLDELVIPLLGSGFAFLLASLLTETVSLVPPARRLLPAPGPRTAALTLLGAFILLLAIDLADVVPHVALVRNLTGAIPYLGPALCVLCLAGAAWWLWDPRSGGREWQGLLLFLSAATLMTLAVAAIAGLYPWAIRRHLVYTVPLLCLFAAEVADRGCQAAGTARWARAAVVGLCGAALLPNIRTTARAVGCTEFNGLSNVLAQAARHIAPQDIVVADHFKWGTPLRFLYGCQVLNGEVLWEDAEAERRRAAFSILEKTRREGRRLLHFTSTADGLQVYHIPLPQAVEIWSSGPVEIRELHHHPEQRSFEPKTGRKLFRLYEIPP